MEQPEDFKAKGKKIIVWRLKKSLHGLKQALRQWYKKLNFWMVNDYKRMKSYPCVYIKSFSDGKFIILLFYVDELLIVGQDIGMIWKLKEQLFKSFDMKDLGHVRHIWAW